MYTIQCNTIRLLFFKSNCKKISSSKNPQIFHLQADVVDTTCWACTLWTDWSDTAVSSVHTGSLWIFWSSQTETGGWAPCDIWVSWSSWFVSNTHRFKAHLCWNKIVIYDRAVGFEILILSHDALVHTYNRVFSVHIMLLFNNHLQYPTYLQKNKNII
jgi:hypothetical protein